MKLRKIATLVVNLIGGAFVVSIGLLMLPIYLAIPWIIFNLGLWIIAPISLLWANEKEK